MEKTPSQNPNVHAVRHKTLIKHLMMITGYMFTDVIYDGDENALKLEMQKGSMLTLSFRDNEDSSKLHICADAVAYIETKPYRSLRRVQTEQKKGMVIQLPKKK